MTGFKKLKSAEELCWQQAGWHHAPLAGMGFSFHNEWNPSSSTMITRKSMKIFAEWHRCE